MSVRWVNKQFHRLNERNSQTWKEMQPLNKRYYWLIDYNIVTSDSGINANIIEQDKVNIIKGYSIDFKKPSWAD